MVEVLVVELVVLFILLLWLEKDFQGIYWSRFSLVSSEAIFGNFACELRIEFFNLLINWFEVSLRFQLLFEIIRFYLLIFLLC